MKLCDPEPKYDLSKILRPGKVNNVVNHFWDHWKKEYFVNLHEHQKIKHQNKHQQRLNARDIVITQEDSMPRSAWKVRVIEEPVKENDVNIREESVGVSRTEF